MTTVTIEGEVRPFEFNNRVARTYEQITGRPYLAACVEFQNLMASIMRAKASGGDMTDAVTGLSMTLMSDMAFAGFSYAYRKAGLPVDFDVDDVAAWMLDNDSVLLEVSTEIMNGIMIKADKNAPDSTKKKTVKTRSTN